MSEQRTNLAANPRPITGHINGWLWQPGTGGVGTRQVVDDVTPGTGLPGYYEATVTTEKTTGNSGLYYCEDGSVADGHAGDVITASMWYWSSAAVTLVPQVSVRSGGVAGGSANAGAVQVQPEVWTRLTATITAPGEYDAIEMWARRESGGLLPVGARERGTGVLFERSVPGVGTYFDGDTPDVPERIVHDWLGEPHASASTLTVLDVPITVQATVLPRRVPVIQVAINGLPEGASWRIQGLCEGHLWPIPRGTGTVDNDDYEQIILIDPRAPMNMPVNYRLTVDGIGMFESNQVVAPLADADVVLSTLDGSWTFVPEFLTAGEFPRAVEPQAVQYVVPGRQRGPVRWAPAGLAPTTWTLHCSERRSDELMALLELGVPLVYRLATPVRDLLPVEFILVTGVESASYPGVGAWRTWTLEFSYIDDPEPSSTIIASVWDDHDAAYADATWDDWDAEWSGATWDEWDRVDWTQRT